MPIAIPDIGSFAKQTLEKAGITSLEQLTKIDEKSLLTLDGVGPKTIEKLKAAMKDVNLSLLQEPFHSFSTGF